jgi:hypothetical protein
MVRGISEEDFPTSWQEERSGERSHDSRDYDTRFMLRLDRIEHLLLAEQKREIEDLKKRMKRLEDALAV